MLILGGRLCQDGSVSHQAGSIAWCRRLTSISLGLRSDLLHQAEDQQTAFSFRATIAGLNRPG
jgi:hypothetical protein